MGDAGLFARDCATNPLRAVRHTLAEKTRQSRESAHDHVVRVREHPDLAEEGAEIPGVESRRRIRRGRSPIQARSLIACEQRFGEQRKTLCGPLVATHKIAVCTKSDWLWPLVYRDFYRDVGTISSCNSM